MFLSEEEPMHTEKIPVQRDDHLDVIAALAAATLKS
jgi:hypothetical protein